MGTLSGFLGADGVTAAYNRTAGETVAASPYTISAALSPGGVLGNYNITYNTANFTITQASTVTSLTTSADPSLFGAPVTFTATVTCPSCVLPVEPPSGTVAFYDGTVPLGNPVTVTVASGQMTASLTTSTLTVGNHTITAVYGGNSNFLMGSPAALGTSAWSIPRGAPPAGVQVVIESATIQIVASMHVVGSGKNPTSQKFPLTEDLKVFDKAQFYARDGHNDDDDDVEPLTYEQIWSGVSAVNQVSPTIVQLLGVKKLSHLNCSSPKDDDHGKECGTKIQYGGGDSYLYQIMVPAATATNQATYGLSGRYLIIGRADVCLNGGASYDYNRPMNPNNPSSAAVGNCAQGGVKTTVYPGTKTSIVKPGLLKPEKNLKVSVDGNGKIHPMSSTEVEGTLLVISEPAYFEFTDSTELLPIIYESVDGDWQSQIQADVPEGFVATRHDEYQCRNQPD